MRIFHYQKAAMRIRWVVLAVLWLCSTTITFVIEYRGEWDAPSPPFGGQGVIPDLLWALTVCATVYYFYLWRVVGTATFTLDQLSLGYSDRYMKTTVAWEDVTELTPTHLRARNGRTVFFKLGVETIADSQEFVEAVVNSAGLVAGPHGAGPARVWSRPVPDTQSAGARP